MEEKDLKIQALTERLAQVVAEAENRVADLRVQITLMTQQLEEANKKLDAAGEENVQEEE